MDDTTKQFDLGSSPVVTTEGFDDPATVQAPTAPEPDADGTAQQDGFLDMVEARLPRGYQLDPEDRLIKRYSARDGMVEISQPFYVKHLELARAMRPAQLVVVVRTVSGAVVSRMLWKFPCGVLRACEGSVFQAARSSGMGSMG